MLTRAQKTEALAILAATYPGAKPALDFTSPFELLVATILSAQCTDVMVNQCTKELFPVANTPAQMAAMTEEELFPYIKRCGFFNTKGRHILETARILMAQYGGEVPANIETLQTLPGVDLIGCAGIGEGHDEHSGSRNRAGKPLICGFGRLRTRLGSGRENGVELDFRGR